VRTTTRAAPSNGSSVAAASVSPTAAVVLAIAATGPSLDSPVAASLSRASHFMIYDPASARYQSIANSVGLVGEDRSVDEIRIAQMLLDRGVTVLMVGAITQAARQSLLPLRMSIVPFVAGTVADAISQYMQGNQPGIASPLATAPRVADAWARQP